MKTLVIHPKDSTTDMLKHVYAGKPYTVITNPDVSESTLRKAIADHDRIIMLGHGLPMGLIRSTKISHAKTLNDYILIGDAYADLLRSKETISIWCYSDAYFRKHGMKGFHTGMIISEVKEAYAVIGACPLTEAALYQNMVRFSQLLGACIELSPDAIQAYMLAHYQGDDAITKFNRQNLLVL